MRVVAEHDDAGKKWFRKTLIDPMGAIEPERRRRILQAIGETHRVLRQAGYPVAHSRFEDDDAGGAHVEEAVPGLEVQANLANAKVAKKREWIAKERSRLVREIRRELGLQLMDVSDANTVFDPEEEKVWLVDLEDVRRIKKGVPGGTGDLIRRWCIRFRGKKDQ